MHAYKVLSEWPSAKKQLHMENVYNSEHGIHLGDKLWKNQQYNTLKVYDSLCSVSGVILENILEWDQLINSQMKQLKSYPSTRLLIWILLKKNLNGQQKITMVQTSIATL